MTRVLLTWLAAYALGAISAGYYLVRLRHGEDVREQGSGATGATNASRLLGRKGFVVVILWDTLKGAAAVALGRLVGLEGWALGGTAVAVTVGHVWPIQLGFRGGRGVATGWGAFLVYVPWMGLLEAGFAAAGAIAFRRVDAGGVLGIALGAVVILLIAGPGVETAVLGILVVLFLFNHREHLAKLFGRMRDTEDEAEGTKEPSTGSALEFREATGPKDFEQIARLNYRTFVEEIPQHAPNEEGTRVDPFLDRSTVFVCRDEGRIVGMLAVSAERPFSLDQKLDDVDAYLPDGCGAPCEVRLLAVEPARRGGRIAAGLIAMMRSHCLERGYDAAFISAAESQRRLYEHLGFVPFGPPIGTAEAPYRGMVVTPEGFSRSVKRFEDRRTRQEEAEGP